MIDTTDVTLWLRDIGALRGAWIAKFIEARRLLRRVRVTVYVPAEQCGDEMLARVQAAIARYTARRVERARNKIRSSRNYGLRSPRIA